MERNPKLNRDLGKNNNGEFAFDNYGNMGGRKSKKQLEKQNV